MKKILLLIVILSLLSLGVACADSIRPVTIVEGREGKTCIDETGVAVITVSPGETAINNGYAYHCDYTNTCTNANELSILTFKTPNTTKWIHPTAYFSTTAGGIAYIYESSDLTLSTGLTVAANNRDRNNSTASVITTIGTPALAGSFTTMDETTAATGATEKLAKLTPIWERPLGAAASGADSGGQERQVNKWILKQNTAYAYVVKSTTADDNIHHITVNFTEKTNR